MNLALKLTYSGLRSANAVAQDRRLNWLALTIKFLKEIRMNTFRKITLVFLGMLTIAGTAYGGKTEAIEGKRYSLTSQHGPWMIMVTSVSDVQGANRKDGMTAWEAADTMVYELRKKGIPAYTCSAEQLAEAELSQGKSLGLSTLLREGDICILAGNFKSIEDKQAQAVLGWIKTKFESSVVDEKKGGLFAKTPGQPSPFGGAILTLNPIYKGEIESPQDDALMVELNGRTPYSILKNKAKYSLRVATFAGGSVMQVGNQSSSKAMGLFDQNFGSNLDACAEEAIALAKALRSATKYGYDSDFEAWVMHDEKTSIVTVGSFSSDKDPRIAPLAKLFGGRAGNVENPLTGDDGIIPATFTLPQKPTRQNPLTKQWFFDKKPVLIKVPVLH